MKAASYLLLFSLSFTLYHFPYIFLASFMTNFSKVVKHAMCFHFSELLYISLYVKYNFPFFQREEFTHASEPYSDVTCSVKVSLTQRPSPQQYTEPFYHRNYYRTSEFTLNVCVHTYMCAFVCVCSRWRNVISDLCLRKVTLIEGYRLHWR